MEELLYWLVGGLGVPLINWLKRSWGLRGKLAMWLTAAISALLALISLALTEQLSLDRISPDLIFGVFGQVLAAATLAYNLLTEKA